MAMTLKNTLLLTGILALTACAPGHNILEPQYWQRISPSETLYQEGPKAQELLDRDIGSCVVELRELERLHMIRNSIPTDGSGKVLDPDQQKNTTKDVPQNKDKSAVLSGHANYEDMTGCMKSKGWERVYAVGENDLH